MGTQNEKTVFGLSSTNVINLSFTGTAANSSAITSTQAPGGTSQWQICSTQDCYVATGNSVVATSSNSFYLPALTILQIKINAGERISALQVSASGTLNCVLMT